MSTVNAAVMTQPGHIEVQSFPQPQTFDPQVALAGQRASASRCALAHVRCATWPRTT